MTRQVPIILEHGERYPHLWLFQSKDWVEGQWPSNDSFDGPDEPPAGAVMLPAALVREYNQAMEALESVEARVRQWIADLPREPEGGKHGD